MSSAVAVRTDTRHPPGVSEPTVRQATDLIRLQVRLAFFRREWSRQTTPLAFTCGAPQNIHSNCTTSHPVERPAFDGCPGFSGIGNAGNSGSTGTVSCG